MKYIPLLLVLLTFSCSGSDEQPKHEAPLVPVRVTSLKTRDVPVYVEALGTLKPHAHIDVRSRLEGVITKVHVQEGAWVKAGDLLFELDPREYEIKIASLEAALRLDQASLSVSQNKKERFLKLSDKSLISQNEWDKLETDILKDQANIDLNSAKLKEAKLDLERCLIYAIKAGRAGKVDIHPGHLVEKGQEAPLVQISSMDPLVVEFHLTEKEFVTLLQDMKEAHVELLSSPNVTYKAKLSFTDNHFDEASGRIMMRAEVANSNLSLRPGMAVRVKIPVQVLQNSLMIAQKAVKYNQFGAYVMLVQPDSSVTLRQVHLGPEYGEEVVVSEGLTLEDVVIVEGQSRATVGSKVDIKT